MCQPYALRVTLSGEAVDSLALSWIQAESPSHLVIKHCKDKDVSSDHWHALLWSPRKLQALRHAFKKAIPGLVNTGKYSLKEVKLGEEGAYGTSLACTKRHLVTKAVLGGWGFNIGTGRIIAWSHQAE